MAELGGVGSRSGNRSAVVPVKDTAGLVWRVWLGELRGYWEKNPNLLLSRYFRREWWVGAWGMAVSGFHSAFLQLVRSNPLTLRSACWPQCPPHSPQGQCIGMWDLLRLSLPWLCVVVRPRSTGEGRKKRDSKFCMLFCQLEVWLCISCNLIVRKHLKTCLLWSKKWFL